MKHRLLALLAWLAALVMFFPVGWMFLSSFKVEADAYTLPPKFLFAPTLVEYANVFNGGFAPYFVNSVVASLVSLLIVLLLGIPAAFALSVRPIERTSDVLFFFLSTRFLPIAGIIVPLYIIARDLNALNNVWTLIALYVGMNIALAVWMLQAFMREIPPEILEAAQLDGANVLKSLWMVVVPLMRPGIAATSVICFIFSWNEFFVAVNLTSTSAAATLPVFLVGFLASEGPFWAQISAAATLAILPALLVGWIAQKSLVRGLTMGAVR